MEQNNKLITNFLIKQKNIFMIIRSEIKKPYNSEMLKITQKYVEVSMFDRFSELPSYSNEILQIELPIDIRQTLDYLLNEEDELMSNNISEIKKYLPIIFETVSQAHNLLNDCNYERAYDLIDSIHCLPEALIDVKKWNARSFWKNYIDGYRKKWDKTFLLDVEKNISNKGFWRKLKRFKYLGRI